MSIKDVWGKHKSKIVTAAIAASIAGGGATITGHKNTLSTHPKLGDLLPPGQLTNPNWRTPHWCIDNQNISGCASDNNDGTVCTCGGGGAAHGPVLHYQEIYANRLGCGGGGRCPDYVAGNGVSSQIFEFISDDTSEIVNMDAYVENSFTVDFVCRLGVPQTIATAAIPVGFTPRSANRSTGVIAATIASGLMHMAIPGVTLNDGLMIQDTTANATFWPYYNLTHPAGPNAAGDDWAMSQPLSTVGNSRALSSEVSVASGDTLKIYQPVKLLVNAVSAYVRHSSGGGSPANNILFTGCDFDGDGTLTVNLNAGVSIAESHFSANGQITPGSNGLGFLINLSAPASAVDYFNNGGSFGGQQNFVLGGIYGRQVTGSQNTLTCAGCQIDEDVVFGQTPGVYGAVIGNFGGAMYLDANAGLIVYPGSQLEFLQALPSSAIAFWGPGTINVAPGANVVYKQGAGKAASTFLQKGQMNIFLGDSTTNVACWQDQVGGTTTCNLPITPTQLDTTLGATRNGCFSVLGAGSFCN